MSEETTTAVADPEAEARALAERHALSGYLVRFPKGWNRKFADGDSEAASPAVRELWFALKACDAELLGAQREVARLTGLIDTPHTADFLEALKLEAAHQIKRWGVEHDRGKNPEDWFWLLGYLAGKCLRAVSDYARTGEARDLEKAKHHTISTAAVMLNWFRRLTGDDLTFQPGADDVAGRDED